MLSHQVRWEFNDNERLGKLSRKKQKLLKEHNWKDETIKLFQYEVNNRVESTAQRVAPFRLQMAGFVLALVICVAGTIVVTVGNGENESVVAGLFLFALGVICLGVGFWYREQLNQRKWRSIAHELQCYFQEQSVQHPGMQFEFHIRGRHHKVNKRTKKKERTSIYYEKYILLTLPENEDDPLPQGIGRRMSFRPEMKGSGSKVDTYDVGYSQRRTVERKFMPEEDETEDQEVLPFWYIVAKDKDGRKYYINNFKKTTQWKSPTPEQIAQEKDEMHSILPPPKYDPKSSSKRKFEEVKKRSIIKRNSLIKIKQGESITKEELIDVKPEDLPEEYRKQHKRKRSQNRPQSRDKSKSRGPEKKRSQSKNRK